MLLLLRAADLLADGELLPRYVRASPQREAQHARTDGFERQLVDEDEPAQGPIHGIRLEHDRLRERKRHNTDLVAGEGARGKVRPGIDVLHVLDSGDRRRRFLVVQFQKVWPPGKQPIEAHPEEPSLELVGDGWPRML